jgi:glycosyltransferase involved in cell wall biosynthesis
MLGGQWLPDTYGGTVSTPTASVVVPIFNGLPFLLDAFRSIEQQSYPNVEIVLVDGGSTDGSLDWIREVASQRAICIDALPRGTPAATTWTRASELATGDFVTLLCQDDVLYPNALRARIAALQARPDALFAASQRDIISASGSVIARGRGGYRGTSGEVSGIDAVRGAYGRAQNIFGEPLAVTFRREALHRHLPWVDTHPFMLDMDMYTRVAKDGSVVFVPESLGAFRVSSHSWSTRLLHDQRDQFARWQASVAADPAFAIPPKLKGRARRNLARQTWLRAAAYRWLRFRGDLAPRTSIHS